MADTKSMTPTTFTAAPATNQEVKKPEVKKAETWPREFILVSGKHREITRTAEGKQVKIYRKGDTVKLTQRQYELMKDRFVAPSRD